MAVYKVPQDVEAEDKLIGPFGFRQFIYLIIVAFACFVAYILSKVFVGLILIPMPFIFFFAALALPLRKDQPTETYLAALLQYNLKPKKRLWMPDGVLSTVEITAPKKVEEKRTKDLSQDEALDRLEHLSQIMDTRGWAARGVFNPDVNSTGNVSLTETIVKEADTAKDILDETSFDKLIKEQKDISQRQAKERMEVAAKQAIKTPKKLKTNLTQKAATKTPKKEEDVLPKNIKYDPYPKSMHQAVVKPLGESEDDKNKVEKNPQDQNSKSTSTVEASPDIINLVDNSEGLKVSTIAKQANRISEQAEEVEIKLH